MTMLLKNSGTLCVPRWATERTPGRKTFGPAIGATARALGFELMPWQQMVADVGSELVVYEGELVAYRGLLVPAYREVRIAVPRQHGKTALIMSWEVHRADAWTALLGKPQRIIYSAQTGNDATRKFLEDQLPILERRKALLGVAKVRRSNGSEGATWKNGSILSLLSSMESAGHGKTVDLAVKDELFADQDDRRDQSFTPAMATRPAAQMITASTMGTDLSIPWNEAVDSGRRAVETGERSGVAYFEWSAPDDADIDDPDVWRACMPALGQTIDIATVKGERAARSEGLFRRAFLNQRTRSDDRVIPLVQWEACLSDSLEVSAECFGLDMDIDRQKWSVVAGGRGAVEVVKWSDDPTEAVSYVTYLAEKYQVPVVVDPSGPAGAMIGPLERAGVTVVLCAGRDLVQSAGGFLDAVHARGVVIRRAAALDIAAASVVKVSVGDAFRWARRHVSVDISPLVAASLALWGSTRPNETKDFFVY